MAADLLELFRSPVRMIEDGVATDVIARQVMSATDDFRDFRELVAAALAVACLESAPDVIALPGGITMEQLAAAASQRGRDARKLAALGWSCRGGRGRMIPAGYVALGLLLAVLCLLLILPWPR